MKDWIFLILKFTEKKKVFFHCRTALLVLKELMQLIEISSQKIMFLNLFVSVVRYPLKIAEWHDINMGYYLS